MVPGQYNNEGIYETVEGVSYNFWQFISSPIRILWAAGKDSLNIVVISIFIIVLGAGFNVMDKTGAISSIINNLIIKYKSKKNTLMYIITLAFMLFGSVLGVFEESVALLPIIVVLSLSLGWDTFTGLGMCLLAVGFGFSTAILNPFSVGLGSVALGISSLDGIGIRILIFIVMYILLCIFLTIHVRKIEKDPTSSITYDIDQEKRKNLSLMTTEVDKKAVKVYSIFFGIVILVMIIFSVVPDLQGYSIPVIALVYLFGVFVCGNRLKYKFKEIWVMFKDGAIGILPAILLIMLAGAVKLILDESLTMDTIIYSVSSMLSGSSAFVTILFIYAVILIMEFFIGSSSAKIALVLPIVAAIGENAGVSDRLTLLAFLFGDGYTNIVYPTNAVLLISLGLVGMSYGKWMKKTWLLQTVVLIITVAILYLCVVFGY